MAKFGIPTDNSQTASALLSELIKLRGLQENNNEFIKKECIVENDRNEKELYLRVPMGDSKSSLQELGKTVKKMIDWKSETDGESRSKNVYAAAKEIERSDPSAFLQLAKDKGYASNEIPKMSADFLVAMAVNANLTVTQLRIINRYLKQHFGARVCVSEKEIALVGSDYVEFKNGTINVDAKEYGSKRISFFYRGLIDLFQRYKEEILEDIHNIRNIEVLLGGDHGKGSMTFMAIIIVRYKNDNEPTEMKLQLAQVNSAKDTMLLLRLIVSKITPGILVMKPKEGKSYLHAEIDIEGKYNVDFNESYIENCTGVVIQINWYLIGDLKFLFMMLGRQNYAGVQCLYCMMKRAEWKEKHSEGLLDCNGKKWTMGELLKPFMDSQNTGNGKPLNSIINPRGQKEQPLWSFIPIPK